MIDRNAVKKDIIVQIPFWFGYIAGVSNSIWMAIFLLFISTIIVIMIERSDQ